MKVGDMVRSAMPVDLRSGSPRTGLVVELIEKKCWRTSVQGKKINWDAVDPEPHAVVLFPHNDGTIAIPVIDLEVVES